MKVLPGVVHHFAKTGRAKRMQKGASSEFGYLSTAYFCSAKERYLGFDGEKLIQEMREKL